MDGTAWVGLATSAALAVLAMIGRRFESAGDRAVKAQGAAAQEWKDLAEAYRRRAEKADADLAAERDAHARAEAAHALEVAGLERRLSGTGEHVRQRRRHEREAPERGTA